MANALLPRTLLTGPVVLVCQICLQIAGVLSHGLGTYIKHDSVNQRLKMAALVSCHKGSCPPPMSLKPRFSWGPWVSPPGVDIREAGLRIYSLDSDASLCGLAPSVFLWMQYPGARMYLAGQLRITYHPSLKIKKMLHFTTVSLYTIWFYYVY